MSHDIRTPMNAIIGITTLMKNELHQPEKLAEHLGKLETSGQLLLGIINNILDMSRIESGKTTLNVEKMNLPQQVSQLDSIIPILAMTANAFLEDMQKSKEAGMDEHLSKPVDIAALEQTVKRFRVTSPIKK